MRATSINAPTSPRPLGGYSQAVEIQDAQRILFISGQIPETRDGEVPSDFRSQARLAWANVNAQLEAASMSIDNLVKVTVFLSSREYAMQNREIRAEVLGNHAPAMTVIITGIFAEKWLLEIEAYAVA
jgi:enamine deaminase RidA (YjgF/YER057c/UK114 family)